MGLLQSASNSLLEETRSRPPHLRRPPVPAKPGGVWLDPHPALPPARPSFRLGNPVLAILTLVGLTLRLSWGAVVLPFRLIVWIFALIGRIAALVVGFCLMVLGAALLPSPLFLIGLPIFLLGLVMTLRSVE